MNYKRIDWPLIIIVLLLSVVGLLSVYSIGQGDLNNFKKQFLFVGLGLFLMLGFSFFDYRILKNHSLALIILYIICLSLLGGVLLFGHEIKGSVSWFRFGIFSFQPIELTKIVIILILAKYFSFRHIEMYRIRHIIASGIYVGLPILLVLFQPDLGSILVLGIIWIGMMLIAGIKMRHLMFLGMITILVVSGSWLWFFKDYQKQRILTFLNPQVDPYGQGYNIVQSLITVGSGQFFGRGFGHGSQSQLNFLPEQQTDFIFAVIAEEWGWLGVFFLLLLFTLLFQRMIKIARNSSNNFSRLFISGLVVMFFSQVIINIGMNMALLPITGLTLPLVSYGGSSLLTIFLGLGIIQSIKCFSANP